MVPRSRWLVALTLLSFPARAEPPALPPAQTAPASPAKPAPAAPSTPTESAPAPPSAPSESAPAPQTPPASDSPPSSAAPEPAPTPEILLLPAAKPDPEPAPTPEPAAPPSPSPLPPPALPSTLTTPTVPKSELPARPSAPLEPRRALALELGAGVNARLGQAAGYSADQPWGAVYGAGLWWNVANATALGLELVHAELGRGSAANGANLVKADYSVTGAWLGGRFTPWQSDALRFFVALRLGLSFEHVAAYGLRQTGSPFESASVFDCKGSHGPAFGVAGGAGVVFRLNSRLDLVSRFDAHGEQLTSDTVGDCAAGLGSATSLSLGLGVAYGFDGPSGQNEPFARARNSRQTW